VWCWSWRETAQGWFCAQSDALDTSLMPGAPLAWISRRPGGWLLLLADQNFDWDGLAGGGEKKMILALLGCEGSTMRHR